MDYLAPQLYWAIAAPQQSFPALFDWWQGQNTRGRHVWPGLAAYRVGDGTSSAFGTTEIPNQVSLTRTRPAGTGHLLYNTTSTLTRNGGAVAASLAGDLYRMRAVPPAYPWLDGAPPAAPGVALSGPLLALTPGDDEAPRWWVVRSRAAAVWNGLPKSA